MHFTFTPRTIPQTIYVVGCGGTGSRLVPMLVQFLRTITKEHSPRGWLTDVSIVLIDGDEVEQKNLARQNFIAADVGKNKAAVLAQRYGKAYGMNVIAYPEFLKEEDKDHLIRSKIPGLGTAVRPEMVFMCVDSAKARRLTLEALTPVSGIPTFFIDAGNEDDFGQVRFFTSHVLYNSDSYSKDLITAAKNPERQEYEANIEFLPYDKAYYDNLQDNPGLGSCADLDQTLAINAMMATFMMGVAQNYFYNKPFKYNEISIALSGSVSMTYNTVSNFRNKTIHFSNETYYIGHGHKYGFASGCQVEDGRLVLDFLSRNKKMVDAIEAKARRDAQLAEAKRKQDQAKAIEAAESLKVTIDVTPEEGKEVKRKRSKKVEAETDLLSVEAGDVVAIEPVSNAPTMPVSNAPGTPEWPSPFRMEHQ
ncbi:thiamine biosynthesis protein ThiF [compost metagenome]